ncbi:hypothetical protein EBQ24_10250 [Allofranklinella schreckenbergeri]|uniref:Uncharacterized protein n=1 Tax=Allofranklinella schreckenbergeri TaxID=1076744 RepID=A0A3M6QVI5_9BURK|nr:hypothetical protein [Allofranklinella schreckenbergeri]RMX07044.1 hypothetical protein EBQ24_10250 [Allofranklinella schreckenbergeri]
MFDFNRPDYSHVAHSATVTVDITAEESAMIFHVFDYGVEYLDDDEMDLLNILFAKLKTELWP